MRNILLSTVLLATTALAGAQSLPTAPHLDLAHRGAFLLGNPAIQSNMGLSPAQVSTVNKIFGQLNARQAVLFKASRPDDQAIMRADQVASDGVLKVLTPVQKKALVKRAIKEAGYTALAADDISAQLKLQPTQQEKIKAILDDAQEPMNQLEELIANAVAKDPKNAAAVEKSYRAERKLRTERKKAAEAKALNVLTAAQKKTWTAITG